MTDLLMSLGSVGVLIAIGVLSLLGILMPLSAYASQKWSYRTYQEVEKLNRKFDELLELMRNRR